MSLGLPNAEQNPPVEGAVGAIDANFILPRGLGETDANNLSIFQQFVGIIAVSFLAALFVQPAESLDATPAPSNANA